MAYLFKYYAGVYDRFMACFKLDNIDVILRIMGDVRGKRILDIGGGTGRLADRLISEGAQVILVDPSPQMTRHAKLKNKAISIYNTGIQTFKEEALEGSFDYVIFRDTLHHIKEHTDALRIAQGYLKPKGRVIIWEFNYCHWKAKIIWWFEYFCFEKSHRFTVPSLLETCEPFFETKYMTVISDYEMLYEGAKHETLSTD